MAVVDKGTDGGLMWLTSGGGPLILVGDDARGAWGGCDEDADLFADSYDMWGDYGRACAAKSPNGSHHAVTIPVGDTEALVLGKAGAPTAYLPEHRLFVQYAPSGPESEFVADLPVRLAQAPWTEAVTWNAPGPATLFDAACAGTDSALADEALRVDIPAGRYVVHVADAGHIFIRLTLASS